MIPTHLSQVTAAYTKLEILFSSLQDMTHCTLCVLSSSQSSYPPTPGHFLHWCDYQGLSLKLTSLSSLFKHLWTLVVLIYLGWLLHLMCFRDHYIYSVTAASPRLTSFPKSEPLPSSSLPTWLTMANTDILKQLSSTVWEPTPGRLLPMQLWWKRCVCLPGLDLPL